MAAKPQPETPTLPQLKVGQVWRDVGGWIAIVNCQLSKDDWQVSRIGPNGEIDQNRLLADGTYGGQANNKWSLKTYLAASQEEFLGNSGRVKSEDDLSKKLWNLLGSANDGVIEQAVGKAMGKAIPKMEASSAKAAIEGLIASDAVKSAIREAVFDAAPVRQLEVKIPDRATNVVDSPHPKLAEALKISQAINNVWFCGPAGSGKTTLGGQLAQALGLDFAFISCTTGMSESKLLGRMNVQGTYLPADFVRIYENGGVFLWDEFDAADPNVVLCANAAMANGKLSVPDRVSKQVAERHKDTILVIATNTWGRGGNSEYSARESIDAATRDRFAMSKIHVDYAHTIEAEFLGPFVPEGGIVAWNPPAPKLPLPQVFAKIRGNIAKHNMRRVLSTRAFQQAASLRKIGFTDQDIMGRFFVDWTEHERTKALEGVC